MQPIHLSEEARRELRENAMTDPPAQIGGLTLRKPGIGTIRLLKKTGNGLFGADGRPRVIVTPENVGEHMDDLLAFIWIHSAPEEEVIRYCHGPREAFERRLSEWALGLDFEILPEILDAVGNDSLMIAAAAVVPEPDDDRSDDPNASGQSGTLP
jgi:hypothetical protein